MTTTGRRDGTVPTRGAGGGSAWAAGVSLLAAALLATVGLFQVVEGLAAILDGELLLEVDGYAFAVDTSVWGWTHLAVGAIAVLVGIAIMQGAAWARAAGIVLAMLSALANFFFIPYYPFWAIVIIAFDVAVIWALTVYDPRRI